MSNFLGHREHQMVIHIHSPVRRLQGNTLNLQIFSITYSSALRGTDSAPLIFTRKPARKAGWKGWLRDLYPVLKSCTRKTKKVAAKILITCSASPGGKLSNLIPPLLLKIIALHAANGFRCLPTHHDHHLEREDKKLKTCRRPTTSFCSNTYFSQFYSKREQVISNLMHTKYGSPIKPSLPFPRWATCPVSPWNTKPLWNHGTCKALCMSIVKWSRSQCNSHSQPSV